MLKKNIKNVLFLERKIVKKISQKNWKKNTFMI